MNKIFYFPIRALPHRLCIWSQENKFPKPKFVIPHPALWIHILITWHIFKPRSMTTKPTCSSFLERGFISNIMNFWYVTPCSFALKGQKMLRCLWLLCFLACDSHALLYTIWWAVNQFSLENSAQTFMDSGSSVFLFDAPFKVLWKYQVQIRIYIQSSSS